MSEQREIQIQIQRESLEAHLNNPSKRSTIANSVGSGKSVIAINRIKDKYKENKKINILYTAARDLYIDNFNKECNKFRCSKNLQSKITRSTIASLHHLKGIRYDLIIYDECHKDLKRFLIFIKSQLMINPNCEVICLTGSPLKFDKNRDTIDFYSICPIVYTHLTDQSVEVGLVNDYSITVLLHDLDTTNNVHIRTRDHDFFTNERKSYEYLFKKYALRDTTKDGYSRELQYLKLFFKNSKTKEVILKSMLDAHNEKNNTKLLVYAGSIEQANKLGYTTYNSKLSKEDRAKNFEKFCKGDIKILVDVDGIKESVTIDNLSLGLISHVSANPNNLIQQVGRLLRLIPKLQVGKMFILVARNTIEEVWALNALKKFDENKIKYVDI